jgi:hypothetical protein
MANGKFVWCRRCEVVHRVTAFDRAPVFDLSAGEVAETPANDWREFMARHAGHALEPLAGTGNDYSPAGSAGDPMAVVYIEASNGKEKVWLRRSRRSIDEAVRYELFDGQLVDGGLSLEIQENEIRKEMKLHHRWPPGAPLGDDKIDLFISLFRDVVSRLDPESVCTSEFSYTDQNICYGRLDFAAESALLAKCRRQFSPSELESLRRFIECHRDGDDVMALVKRRCVTVEPPARSKAQNI